MKILVKTKRVENGKIFAYLSGERLLLAECNIEIEHYEEKTALKILGSPQAYKKKNTERYICSNCDYTRELSSEFLNQVHSFDLEYDMQRQDGIYERKQVYNIGLCEIDLPDTWTFES